MTPERWQKVKEIFQAALDKPAAERIDYVAQVCDGDDELRNEVESLLASSEKDGSFIDSPAYAAAATLITSPPAELKKGTTVGAYDIVSFISRGGMGEVYLAHDRRLGRKVALKILPGSFTQNQERLRRFEQEARSASALNHPNIITIYEILKSESTHVIATEYVEGETLRHRLSNSKLELSEALDLATQVADALSAAHKAGIVHRDIKPENIMIRQDGYVKVLDFGLAKLSEEVPSISADEAPTRQVRTGSGVIIGTAGYMSPEQARGKPVDARSDIFSLGAVIYEMVTRRKPFDGETPSDVLASILKTEPAPVSEFVPDLPPELNRIVNKALRKDREERYQVTKDLLLDLKSLAQDLEFHQRLKQSRGSSPAVAAGPSSESLPHPAGAMNDTNQVAAATTAGPAFSSMIRPRRWPTVALAALIVAGGVFSIYYFLLRKPASIIAPPVIVNNSRITAWSGMDAQPTLAPDGNSVAYTSDHKGSFEIYVKQLTPGGREIQLTDDGQENFQPAWSPDGKLIAYFSKKRGGIWVMPALGGDPRQLADFGSGPAWSHDGSAIAFQSDSNPDMGAGSVGSSTIWIVSVAGGAPRQLTKIGNPAGGHVSPTWSPDGKTVAFINLSFNAVDQQIWSVSVGSGDVKKLTNVTNGRIGYPLYSSDGGGIYYLTNFTLWMLPISSSNGEPAGEPMKVADGGASIMARLSLSADGKRLAVSLLTTASNIWSIPLSPKSNEATGVPRPLTNQTGVRNNLLNFSPDGKKIAFSQLLRGGVQTISVMDQDGKNPVELTTNKSFLPSWFPDNDQIAYISNDNNRRMIYLTSLQSKRARPLLDIGKNIEYARLSPDGKQLAFNLTENGIINVWTAAVSGGQPKQLTFDKELAAFPCWSPDGKFIAYQMKRGDDIYVMLIPSNGGEPIQLVSDHGRSWPYAFSPDGDKIAFAGDRGGVWNVYWVSRSTKQVKSVSNYTKLNAYVRYPAWSPLGNQIAYEYGEATGNIWVMDLK